MGLDYSRFAAVLVACFTLICCVVVLFLYCFHNNRDNASILTMSMLENRLDEDEKYAMSMIGKDSCYSFFVTEKVYGWLIAFATLAAQAGILVFFIRASEVNLQNDTIDLEFTWKCPRDSEICNDKSDLTPYGWTMFCILVIVFLAKDLINGSKLIYLSSKARHPLWSRMRYFVGGWSLCTITLFAFYVRSCCNVASCYLVAAAY